MKKINSKNLWEYINGLSRNEKVKFNVYYDDNYVTKIVWNGENFEWESGTFTSEAFFKPLYDFEVIEEEFEDIEECFAGVELEYNKNSIEYKINQLIKNQKNIIEKLKGKSE